MHLPFDNCSQVHESVATRVFMFDHVHHPSKMFERASQSRCVYLYILTLNNRHEYTFSNKCKNRKYRFQTYLCHILGNHVGPDSLFLKNAQYLRWWTASVTWGLDGRYLRKNMCSKESTTQEVLDVQWERRWRKAVLNPWRRTDTQTFMGILLVANICFLAGLMLWNQDI